MRGVLLCKDLGGYCIYEVRIYFTRRLIWKCLETLFVFFLLSYLPPPPRVNYLRASSVVTVTDGPFLLVKGPFAERVTAGSSLSTRTPESCRLLPGFETKWKLKKRETIINDKNWFCTSCLWLLLSSVGMYSSLWRHFIRRHLVNTQQHISRTRLMIIHVCTKPAP